MKSNIRQNLQTVVHIATKYYDLLGATKLIDLFEKYKTAGLLYYLGSIVNVSEDPDVNFKYMGIRFIYPYAVISAPPSPPPKSILAAAIQPRRPPVFPLDFSYIAAGLTNVGGGISGRYTQTLHKSSTDSVRS
ncbi:Clathrin heavy chain [Pseudogymnoascus australis]